MVSITVKGTKLELDENGFLGDWEKWNKDVAQTIAEGENIVLTDAHWEIINFLREYYAKYQIAPMIRILVKETQKTLGPDKNLKYIYGLFPAGPAKQACKIAGLPKPTGCV
jgi:tRNA 2-thiouridine synthesizing protein E|tara:strand:- start:72 stop:404 length:333 start_codon:yes stop_codon:yes gene_type:complete